MASASPFKITLNRDIQQLLNTVHITKNSKAAQATANSNAEKEVKENPRRICDIVKIQR